MSAGNGKRRDPTRTKQRFAGTARAGRIATKCHVGRGRKLREGVLFVRRGLCEPSNEREIDV